MMQSHAAKAQDPHCEMSCFLFVATFEDVNLQRPQSNAHNCIAVVTFTLQQSFNWYISPHIQILIHFK